MIKPYTSPPGGAQPWEYMTAGEIEDCSVGMALTFNNNGQLMKAVGNSKPQYISMYGRPTEEGQVIPVIRANPDMLYVTSFSEDAAAIKVGDKVTLDGTGLYASATTEGGFMEIVSMEGTAAGDAVTVRFV